MSAENLECPKFESEPNFGVHYSLLILFFVVLLDCISAAAQQSKTFTKPAWLQCDTSVESQKRILNEYGAVYLSVVFNSPAIVKPSKCLFSDEVDLKNFTTSFKISQDKFSFGDYYLQPKAKEALEKVFSAAGGYKSVARNCNDTTPTCPGDVNDDWAARTYEQTKCNWLGLGKNLAQCRATQLVWADIEKEVKKEGTSKPKMFSVAIPGGSQHHLGLAIDVDKSKCDATCFKVLEQNGWFRTVRFDSFHFTYLGYKESELPGLGLKKVKCNDNITYWVPNVTGYNGYQNFDCAIVN